MLDGTAYHRLHRRWGRRSAADGPIRGEYTALHQALDKAQLWRPCAWRTGLAEMVIEAVPAWKRCASYSATEGRCRCCGVAFASLAREMTVRRLLSRPRRHVLVKGRLALHVGLPIPRACRSTRNTLTARTTTWMAVKSSLPKIRGELARGVPGADWWANAGFIVPTGFLDRLAGTHPPTTAPAHFDEVMTGFRIACTAGGQSHSSVSPPTSPWAR